MQPGLRRIAPGAAQLTPSAPGGRHLREKLAVLGSFADAGAAVDARLRRAPPCFAPSPTKRRARAPAPSSCDDAATARLGSTRRGSAGRSTPAARRAATATRRSAPASPRCRRRGGRARFSRSRSRRTSPSSTARARRSRGSRSACRRAGRPRTRSAATSPRSTRRSPTTTLLVAASASLARLVTGDDRWERFVWTISADPRLHQHPGARRPGLAGRGRRPTPKPLVAQASFRSERQTFIPIAGSATRDLHDPRRQRSPRRRGDERRCRARGCMRRSPACRRRCSATAASTVVRDRLLAWLAVARRGPAARADEDGADRPGADRHRRRRHAAIGRVRRRLPPALGRARAGAPRLPRRRRARRALARQGPLRRSSRPASGSATTSSPRGRPGAPIRTRCRQLHFISIEASPPTQATLGVARARRVARAARRPSSRAVAAAHLQPAPPRRSMAAAVELLLAFGAVDAWLPQLVADVDAFFLDGFAPARNPAMWDARLFKAMARLAAPDATVATWSAARAVRDGLRSAGFAIENAPRQRRQARHHARPLRAALRAAAVATASLDVDRRDSSRGRSRGLGAIAQDATADAQRRSSSSAPASPAARWPGRSPSAAVDRSSSSAARRVAERRLRQSPPGSSTASSIRGDGRHARFHRAAALVAGAAVREAIQRHGVRGSVDGLLRSRPAVGLAAMQSPRSTRRGCPPTTSRRSIAAAASRARRASRSSSPAWHYPAAAGSIRAASRRSWLDRAGASVDAAPRTATSRRCAGSATAGQLSRRRSARRSRRRRVVVLCNGGGAPGARRRRAVAGRRQPRPAQRHRRDRARADCGCRACRSPAPATCFRAIDGTRLVRRDARPGTTTTRRSGARTSSSNLDRLAALLGLPASPALDRALVGRVGFRWASRRSPADHRRRARPASRPAWRPASSGQASARFDQPRFVARAPGPVRAVPRSARAASRRRRSARRSWRRRSPARRSPAEADLLDAVDPARFLSRALSPWRGGASARRGAAGSAPGGPHRRVGRRLSGLGAAVRPPHRRHRRRRACARPCPFPSVPSSSSSPVRVVVFRMNSWVWPRAVLPVSCTGRARERRLRVFRASDFSRWCQNVKVRTPVGGAEQTDGRAVAREDADADDARPLVDLASRGATGSSMARPWTSRISAAVVGDDAFAQLRPAADRREPARDLRRRHRDHLDRQRKAAEPRRPASSRRRCRRSARPGRRRSSRASAPRRRP